MKETLITVGITAYQEGELLREAWQSVVNQTFQDWKAILLLDGGADELTQKIFDEINDSRLKKIKMSHNMGPYPCRNLAIKNCETDVYFFLDADDFLDKDAIAKAHKKFLNPEIDYLCVGVELFWENGQKQLIPPRQTNPERLIRYHEFPGMVAFRKKVWEEIGGYSNKLKRGKADFDFILSLLERNYQPEMIHDAIYYYRQRINPSISKSYGSRLGRICEIIVSNHSQSFSNNQLKKNFLNQGYLISSWQCFQKGEIRRAYYFASKGIKVGRAWDYWPLYLANYFPILVLKLLIYMRQACGEAFRSTKGIVSFIK